MTEFLISAGLVFVLSINLVFLILYIAIKRGKIGVTPELAKILKIKGR